jgi:hypothetical protein
MDRSCTMYGMRNAYRILVGNTKGKRSLGGPRWENIKMDLREIGWGGTDCSNLTWDKDLRGGGALVNIVMKHRSP